MGNGRCFGACHWAGTEIKAKVKRKMVVVLMTSLIAAEDIDDPANWLVVNDYTHQHSSRALQNNNGGSIDWALTNCCDTQEITFLSLMGVYLVIICILWRTILMKPMKLIAVFAHEFSHASACWMTGGKVTGIEVNSDEGGVTKYVGGWRWFIIPAGECAY